MTTTALSLVQAAIYLRLTGDTTLMALIVKVVDGAPNPLAFPYIDIGDGDELPYRVFGGLYGRETYKTIRIWTQDDKGEKGYKRGQAIYERANTLLDCFALVVTGRSTVTCQFEDVFQNTGADGITREIAATYKVITQ